MSPKISIPRSLFTLVFLFFSLKTPIFAQDLWVSNDGEDAENCGPEFSPCRTIGRALSVATPGDTINVRAGKYIEQGDCSWFEHPVSVCVRTSGTLDLPITLRAAPGSEKKVVIDSESQRVGLLLTGSTSYVQVKDIIFVNNRQIGVASPGRITSRVADDSFLSKSVLIERCEFYNTSGKWGTNISAVGMWASKDWIVRNNIIRGVHGEDGQIAYGIQAYGVVNATIEHNDFDDVDAGVYWKDHFVEDEDIGAPVFESEIRFNRINARLFGFYVNVRASDSVAPGSNIFRHNIVSGYGDGGAGVRWVGAGRGQRGYIHIHHNIFHPASNSAMGIAVNNTPDLRVFGNIFILRSDTFRAFDIETRPQTRLQKMDHNIYGGNSFSGIIDRYGDTKVLGSLSAWQKLTREDAMSLEIDYPDINSRNLPTNDIFGSGFNTGDYSYSPSSVAVSFMPDESNAGPYQHGDEVIGVNLSGLTRPKAPEIMGFD